MLTQGHGGQLEQVPIATGWRQSETLTKRPVHRKATLTQTYYIYIVFFKHYMHVFWTVEGRWRTRREAQQTQGGHVKCTLKGPIPGVKPKTFLLWCRSNLCANVLPILCGLKKKINKKKKRKDDDAVWISQSALNSLHRETKKHSEATYRPNRTRINSIWLHFASNSEDVCHIEPPVHSLLLLCLTQRSEGAKKVSGP